MTKQAGVIQGRIADRSVAALFQSLHEERTTGIARFRTALGSATVWLRDGEIIDADMGRFHMEAAVLRLRRRMKAHAGCTQPFVFVLTVLHFEADMRDAVVACGPVGIGPPRHR